MGAHLRQLSKCDTCGKPATEQLYNAVNVPLGVYCTRHSNKALNDFINKYGEYED